MGYFDPLLADNRACIRAQVAGDDLHERGFPGAVTPQERHALAGFQLQTQLIKNQRPAEGDGNFL